MSVEKIVNLRADSELLKTLFTDLVDHARAFVVYDDISYEDATAFWKRCRDIKKEVETLRKKAVEPYRYQISLINDKAKLLLAPVEEAESLLGKATLTYKREKESEQVKENEKRIALAEIFGDEPTLQKVQKPVSAAATTFTKASLNIEITDFEAIPRHYLMLNEAMVKQAYKSGVKNIPGLKLTEEKTEYLRSR